MKDEAINTTLAVKKGHPKGLYVLSFTEMWERFGYYLMIGILYLFLHDTIAHGGKGFDDSLSIEIVGTFIAMVYLTPFIGGLVADRILGYTKSIFFGGALMAAGYFLLSINGSNGLLYLSLALVVIGNGFFKPNISTLLGNIYNTEELKVKKDSAYNIFYMGINIGAFVCNFVAAYLRNTYTWGFAFAAAGVGMTIALIWLMFNLKHVKFADVIKPSNKEDMPISKIALYVFLPAIIAGLIGWFLPGILLGDGKAFLGHHSDDAFVAGCIPIVIFYFRVYLTAAPFDKRRIGTLLTLFGVAIIFWNIYNQNSTSLTIWAESYTNRKLPFKGGDSLLKKINVLQTVNTTPGVYPKLDDKFRTISDSKGNALTETRINPYFQNLPKEQWPLEKQDLKLISTEEFQSINPFWVVILTPVIVGLFGWMRARKKEPSTPSKIAWGIIIAGLSSLVMVFACLSTNIYHFKVSSGWLIASYGVFTISELFLSPIGLSLVSKVAPRRLTSLMMGGWFLTTSIGGKISGMLAGVWNHFDNKALFFAISTIAAIIAGLAIMPLTKKLAKVVDEATASTD